MTPSKRQKHQLKSWAKGKSIKMREIEEFKQFGWIAWHSGTLPNGGGYELYPYLTDAGREVIGPNTRTVR